MGVGDAGDAAVPVPGAGDRAAAQAASRATRRCSASASARSCSPPPPARASTRTPAPARRRSRSRRARSAGARSTCIGADREPALARSAPRSRWSALARRHVRSAAGRGSPRVDAPLPPPGLPHRTRVRPPVPPRARARDDRGLGARGRRLRARRARPGRRRADPRRHRAALRRRRARSGIACSATSFRSCNNRNHRGGTQHFQDRPRADALLGRSGRQPGARDRAHRGAAAARRADRLPAGAVPLASTSARREDHANFDLAEPIPGPTTEALARWPRADERRRSSPRCSSGARPASTTTPRSSSTPTASCSASTARCTSRTIRSTTRSSTSRPATSASARSTRACGRIGTLVCWDQWYPGRRRA